MKFCKDQLVKGSGTKALIKWSGQLIKVRCVSFAGKIYSQVKSGFPYE